MQKLLKAIEDKGLYWDKLEEAKKIKDPKEFEEFFRKYHSKEVCEVLFDNKTENLPLYINVKDDWLQFILEWKMKED